MKSFLEEGYISEVGGAQRSYILKKKKDQQTSELCVSRRLQLESLRSNDNIETLFVQLSILARG